MKSLREFLPQLEIDWLLPLWLLLAIVGAAVAETVTIGLGVWQTYQIWTGWLVGGVVASAQAMGSMMWARASQYNASVKLKTAPRLSVFWPALISVLAGVVSGWVGLYLYRQSELTGLGRALAVASPAGSIAAAVLNGVFASGEAAIAEFENERKLRRKPTQGDVSVTQADASLTSLTCWCGASLRNRYALASHSRKHLREVTSASDAASARAALQELYPGRDVPGVADVAAMRRKAQERNK